VNRPRGAGARAAGRQLLSRRRASTLAPAAGRLFRAAPEQAVADVDHRVDLYAVGREAAAQAVDVDVQALGVEAEANAAAVRSPAMRRRATGSTVVLRAVGTKPVTAFVYW